jgi:glycosyltransferase involved in cell wall biosynthesis
MTMPPTRPHERPVPEVSVVVPVRNGAATIGQQLDALASQSFDGIWDVVVVDDASTDGTAEVASRWSDKLPSLRVLTLAEHGGASYAYNVGTRAALGPCVAYCDADDVVSSRWLAAMMSGLQRDSITTGPLDLTRLNPRRLYAWRRSPWADPLPPWNGFLVPVINANMAVHVETFESLGGFDETLDTNEDYEFAFRAQLAGASIGFVPDAVVHYRLRHGLPYFRREYQYGLGHVELYRRFRHVGMRRNWLRGFVRLAGAVLGAPLVLIPKYRYGWITLAGVELGRLEGSLRYRTLFL